MHFPFEFVKSGGAYDFFSPIVNSIGNAVVLAVGGISLGAISYLALKALGFSEIATTIATAIPITIGAVGIVGVIVGISVFIAMLIGLAKGLGHR